MQILELNMKHFGMFRQQKVLMRPGVNIIYGGNETGKSTIHAFIRAMLYGITPRHARGSRMSEYDLRQPWEDSEFFEGSMLVEADGKTYRIDRNFTKNNQSVTFTDVTDGRELDPENIPLLMGGISEAAFCNTFYIPQASVETGDALAEELRSFMMNMKRGGDSAMDVDGALELLKARKRELEKQQKADAKVLDEKINQRRMEVSYLENDLERMRNTDPAAQFAQGTAEAAAAAEFTVSGAFDQGTEQEEGPEAVGNIPEASKPAAHQGPDVSAWNYTDVAKEKALQEAERRSRYEDKQSGYGDEELEELEDDAIDSFPNFLLLLRGLLLVVAVLALAMIPVASGDVMAAVMIVLGGLALLSFIMITRYIHQHREFFRAYKKLRKSDRKARRQQRAQEAREREAERKAEEEKQRQLLEEQQRAYREAEKERQTQLLAARKAQEDAISQKASQLDAVAAELDNLARQSDALGKVDLEIEALDLAMNRIQQLTGDIYLEAGKAFSRRASQILSELTEGRYTAISLDEHLEVRVNTPDRLLYLSQISYGSMNQIYFALRCAAGELLGGNQIPVILDDTFSMYDDDRLTAALTYLERSARQVVILTCHTREKALLDMIRGVKM